MEREGTFGRSEAELQELRIQLAGAHGDLKREQLSALNSSDADQAIVREVDTIRKDLLIVSVTLNKLRSDSQVLDTPNVGQGKGGQGQGTQAKLNSEFERLRTQLDSTQTAIVAFKVHASAAGEGKTVFDELEAELQELRTQLAGVE